MSADFWVLLLVPFILVLSNSLLIPVLPQIQTAGRTFKAGLLYTFPYHGLVIPGAGYLSDRIGKAVMVPALVYLVSAARLPVSPLGC